ncbi:MAG TPA: ATP-grasp domain-containing protein [Kofleriaceae bacterium]|nr:ATP-grasp domain-containing protein [Kofleriaceae bacterium]
MLLLDEGWAQTIDLAAGLEQAGYQVTVLTANGGTASYRHRTVAWRSGPALASSALLPHLDRMMGQAAFDRVLPLTEAAMMRLWDASPGWAERIYPQVAEWQRRLLRDKYALSEYLAARGVAVPRQQRLVPGVDPAAIACELGLPLVVKGATGAGGDRVWIVETVAELAGAMRRARRAGGAWGVQELVEGPTVLFGGVFHDGSPLRIYAGNKLEQHPRRTGPAIRMRSIDDPALVELGTRILRELRWTGLASVDFIRRRDGSYAFLEVNPRLWGSVAAARPAGVDLFAPFAELLAGELPAPDLAFTAGRDVRIFPRYLLSPAYWCPGGLARAVRDLLGDQGRPWCKPGFLRHLACRLYQLHRGRESQ